MTEIEISLYGFFGSFRDLIEVVSLDPVKRLIESLMKLEVNILYLCYW